MACRPRARQCDSLPRLLQQADGFAERLALQTAAVDGQDTVSHVDRTRPASPRLSGSMYAMRGGEDSVSVVNTPPCSWMPKPIIPSLSNKTSVVSVWTTCPARPTVLDARDTERQGSEVTLRGGAHEDRNKSRPIVITTIRPGGPAD
ncbi:hypothetical protein CRUP_005184, partial [Coryphaenoides rupestris]